jgi:uncharacterized protein (DUF1684 family)
MPRLSENQLFLPVLSLCLLFLSGTSVLSSPGGEKELPPGRKEQLQIFREKRDRFFKEDAHSPLTGADRKRFKGLLYYPIDLQYAVIGSVETYPAGAKPVYVNLPTSKGQEKRYVRTGRFRFRLGAESLVLQIYRPLAGEELFLPFRDRTSGMETYPGGRYLYVEPLPGGRVLIDFNRAYNPFCEFSDKYICPLAPPENWLDIPIRAGEKRYRSGS